MNFFDPSAGKAFVGTMTQVTEESPSHDYKAHTHIDNDTYLNIDGVWIPGYPSKSPNSLPSKCQHCSAEDTVEYLGPWNDGLGNAGTDWWCSQCGTTGSAPL